MYFALEHQPKKSSTHRSLAELSGIAGEHLTDIDQLGLLANELDLPDHARDIHKVKTRRKWIRAADALSQIATLSSITALSHITSWGAEGSGLLLGLGAGAFIVNATIRALITGKLGTDNDSTLVHESSALASELRRANLGSQGDEAADALSLLPNVTDEERMLYARPGELILSEVAQWIALIANSPEPLNTAIVGVFNTIIAAAQTFFVHRGFAPANKAFVEKSTEYLAQPSNADAREAYLDAKKRKVAATAPINFLSSISGFFPLLVGKLPVSTMVAGLVARGMSAFTNITQRTISITHARDIHRNLRPKIEAALQELKLFIKNPQALESHIRNSTPEAFRPVNLAEKVKDLDISDAILVNAQVKYPDQLGNRYQLILSFNNGHNIKVIAGGNGSGKTTLRRLITHEMDNHLGYVGIVTPEGGLKDIHDYSYDELKSLFPYWSDSTYRTPTNPLSAIPARRLQEIANIKGLSWITQSRVATADANSGYSLSDGERKVVSILHFVETHRNQAHSLWLDEIYAKLDPTHIQAVNTYLQSTNSRFVIIQQDIAGNNFDPIDIIYLEKGRDHSKSLSTNETPLAAEAFFSATSADIHQNPLVRENVWEKDPLRFVELIASRNGDAIQLFSRYKIIKFNLIYDLLESVAHGVALKLNQIYQPLPRQHRVYELDTLDSVLEIYAQLKTILPYAAATYDHYQYAITHDNWDNILSYHYQRTYTRLFIQLYSIHLTNDDHTAELNKIIRDIVRQTTEDVENRSIRHPTKIDVNYALLSSENLENYRKSKQI